MLKLAKWDWVNTAPRTATGAAQYASVGAASAAAAVDAVKEMWRQRPTFT